MKIFIITIENNKTSESYYRTCKESLRFNHHDALKFRAITPETLPEDNEINFVTLKSNKSNGKEWNTSQKSLFYSQYMLWQKCVELNEPIIILEHDTIMVDKIPKDMIQSTILGYRLKNNIKVPAAGAGLYLTPEDSQILIDNSLKPVNLQGDGYVHNNLNLDFKPCFFNYQYDKQTTLKHN